MPMTAHHRGARIDDRDAGAHGRPLHRPVHRHDAGIGVGERLVAGFRGERPRPAERADLAIDDARIARLQRLKADAERLREAGSQIVDQHIRPFDERKEAPERRVLLEVHDRGALVAVEDVEGERMAFAVLLHEPEPGVVAARLLDLDDVGAEIGEDRARIGAGDVLADLDDGEAGKRHGRRRSCSARRRTGRKALTPAAGIDSMARNLAGALHGA